MCNNTIYLSFSLSTRSSVLSKQEPSGNINHCLKDLCLDCLSNVVTTLCASVFGRKDTVLMRPSKLSNFLFLRVCIHVFLRLSLFLFLVFQDLTAPDMAFIIDWIYSGFNSVLQMLGKCSRSDALTNSKSGNWCSENH